MHRISAITFAILIIFSLSAFGCQNNAMDSPVTLSDQEITQEQFITSQNHMLVGYYNLAFNLESAEINVLPARNIDLHLNITNIINGSMGLGIELVPGETNLAIGLIVFDMTFTHPFPLNPEFSAFDMKGIMITPGSMTVGDLVMADYDETRVLNADGYSRWWNPTEFTTPGIFGYSEGLIATGTPLELSATINPYKLFADVLGAEDTLSPVSGEPITSPNGRAVFKAGESNTRRYEMQFEMNPDIQLIFGYAIDACWDVPDPNPPTDIPADFPINANSNEAFRIAVAEVVNTLYYDDDAGSGGGSLVLNINIQDWQGINNGNVQNEITSVTLMSPDLLAADVAATFLSDSGAVAFYTADLTGLVEPTRPGINQVIIEVESSDGTTYKQAVPPAPEVPVAAYQVHTVDIPILSCEIDANNEWSEAFEMEFGDTVEDIVCLPNDYRDFYYFEIPGGSVLESGQVTLTCSADQTKVGLYSDSYNLLSESPISGGTASINLYTLGLDPGTYFFRVYTSNSNDIGLYTLELTGGIIDTSPLSVTDVTPPDLYVWPIHAWMQDEIMYSYGYGHWIYDLSTPSSPQNLYGETDRDLLFTTYSDFEYPYCFFSQYDVTAPPVEYDIYLIDYSDPNNPVQYDQLVTINYTVTCLTINSTHIYVGLDSLPDPNILIYEYASNPQSPTLVGQYILGGGVPVGLDLLDAEGPDTILAIITSTDIYCRGVEDPASVTDEGTAIAGGGWELLDIKTNDPYIYGLGWNTVGLHGAVGVWEQTVGGPIIVNSANLPPGNSQSMALEFPYVYVAEAGYGISVVNVSNPLLPAYLATVLTISIAGRLTVENDKLVALFPWNGSFEVFDLTNPALPSSLGHRQTFNGYGNDVIFEGDYLITGDALANYTIDVMDISNPAETSVVAENPVPFYSNYIAKDGDLIVAANNSDIMFLDASDPLNMTLLATHFIGPTLVKGVLLKDNYFHFNYASGGNIYLETWIVEDPVSPTFGFPQDWPGSTIGDFEIHGNLLFLVVQEGVRIYSVAVDGIPALLTIYETPQVPWGLEVRNQYMYLNMPNSSMLEIVDISDPLAPVHVSTEFSAYSPIATMAVDGQYAYFTGSSLAISAMTIFPPEDPEDYGIVYDDVYYSSHLYARDGYLYEFTNIAGLRIFDLY